MDELRARFAGRSQADREALQTAWAAGDRDALQRLSHGLAGSAGLFGYPDLSNAARGLEEALDHDASEEDIRTAFETVMHQIPGNVGPR